MYIIAITTSNVFDDKILYNLFNICFFNFGLFYFQTMGVCDIVYVRRFFLCEFIVTTNIK